MKKKIKIYVVFIVLCLLVGYLSSILSGNIKEILNNLVLPKYMPPTFIFPIVWNILYILMGISAGNIYLKTKRFNEISYFFIQLFFNFWWSIIFFRFQNYNAALIWLLILLVFVILMFIQFYRINKKTAFLQIPYIIWLCIAAYLNISIVILN